MQTEEGNIIGMKVVLRERQPLFSCPLMATCKAGTKERKSVWYKTNEEERIQKPKSYFGCSDTSILFSRKESGRAYVCF